MSLPVDVIVIEGVPAAYDPNGHISIVSPVLIDPLERGFAVSLAHPGGNITGFTLMHAELNGKRLDLLRSAFAYNHRRRTGKSRKLKPQIGVRNRLKRLPGSLVRRVSAGSRPKASPPSASCVQPSSREPALCRNSGRDVLRLPAGRRRADQCGAPARDLPRAGVRRRRRLDGLRNQCAGQPPPRRRLCRPHPEGRQSPATCRSRSPSSSISSSASRPPTSWG